MMMAQNWLLRHGLISFGSGRSKKRERVELERDLAHTLRGGQRWIRVTSGGAWVTAKGVDLILYAGDVKLVKPGKNGAVVTSLDGSRVVFETWTS